jgi:hypothetical protein
MRRNVAPRQSASSAMRWSINAEGDPGGGALFIAPDYPSRSPNDHCIARQP